MQYHLHGVSRRYCQGLVLHLYGKEEAALFSKSLFLNLDLFEEIEAGSLGHPLASAEELLDPYGSRA